MSITTKPLIPLPTSLSTAEFQHCPGCGRPLPPPRVRCGPCVAAAWFSLEWSPEAAGTKSARQ